MARIPACLNLSESRSTYHPIASPMGFHQTYWQEKKKESVDAIRHKLVYALSHTSEIASMNQRENAGSAQFWAQIAQSE